MGYKYGRKYIWTTFVTCIDKIKPLKQPSCVYLLLCNIKKMCLCIKKFPNQSYKKSFFFRKFFFSELQYVSGNGNEEENRHFTQIYKPIQDRF